MYIKFCRSLFVGKKDGDNEKENLPKLSVELEGKKSGGNTCLYPTVCVFLGLICLILLVVVISLSVKLQTGSTICQGHEKATGADKSSASSAQACSFDQCQAVFNGVQAEHCKCQKCAPGWTACEQSCFYFSTTRLSWDESRRNCISRGGSLAVVTSPELQSFLAKTGSLNYWIGLRQTGAEWTWVNRTVLKESHWAESPKDGDCVFISARNPPEKNWIRASCQSYTYYICQRDL